MASKRTKSAFQPRLDILPPAQRRLWDELGETPPGFVLYGGTAIALRLAHRHSEDFDFFSNQNFEPRELLNGVRYLKASTVRQESANTLTCRIDRSGRVLVSFFGGLSLNRVADPDLASGTRLPVASLLDLAATKLVVVVQRASLKDYLDLDAILQTGIDLPTALAAARAVHGEQFNPLLSLKALTFFEEGDVKRLEPERRHRLSAAARAVNIHKLPDLGCREGLA